ncbi:hypothetical protein QQ045_032795 [Rhodiola kirilowii]
MIHTYKRKRTSLKSCSFYERVCGDLLVGCSALATPIQDNISNGCYSRETKEVSGFNLLQFSLLLEVCTGKLSNCVHIYNSDLIMLIVFCFPAHIILCQCYS